MTKSRNILPPRKVWAEEEIELLKRRYPNERAESIAEALGCKVHIVYTQAKKLGIKKSSAFKSSAASGRLDGVRGADTRFKKGNIPWTKGTHFVAGGRSAETRFKPGIVPHNIVPVGTTVMATQGYLKTKVAEPNKWRWTHRLKWEEVNGPIPRGMMLVFKDGPRTNCEPSNLELITRKQHIDRHTIHNLPPELRQVIQLTGALQRRINNHGK
ncbi:MAG: hypothetical protein B7Y56_03315 [Gallionellales bacterium 35-53-114]|jgi:hypothetical protein|nr:MAG: hypothetical protein B7Y56_03315 [Gallionellales bacterium 35-53-114]OYZ65134.1 MAG: hypothetical protein B7Y04_00475 [Gallionellales bacterium 24-53-125]OZB08042.1 MAG: hypothetical protein B7X61_10925 [Gallionellales bacterium 39-52-133]HQS59945.1 HNH endonuclease signature motif containing protein [Gallionellaceae bacterium]HQS76673.1 HNH endonuclease signature motif containing protein [Gallionellaceae bacterium]